jgi:hypothetical protein
VTADFDAGASNQRAARNPAKRTANRSRSEIREFIEWATRRLGRRREVLEGIVNCRDTTDAERKAAAECIGLIAMTETELKANGVYPMDISAEGVADMEAKFKLAEEFRLKTAQTFTRCFPMGGYNKDGSVGGGDKVHVRGGTVGTIADVHGSPGHKKRGVVHHRFRQRGFGPTG